MTWKNSEANYYCTHCHKDVLKEAAKEAANKNKVCPDCGYKLRLKPRHRNRSPEYFLNRIICGDAPIVMREMPDNFANICFTDPPYNISKVGADITRKNSPSYRFKGRNVSYDFGEWDRIPQSQYKGFMKKWINEAVRILKKDANFVCFIAKENITWLHEYMLSKDFKYRNVLVWVKSNPVPHLRKVNFASAVEFIYWCSRGKNIFNWQLGHSPNYFIAPLCQGKERMKHPTQKPEVLVEWILKYLSKEDDVVLDPLCGTGTTCRVAQKLGRKWIGIDIDPKYARMAEASIKSLLSSYLNRDELDRNRSLEYEGALPP